MGEYRNEDEGLVDVARELAYAYLDAGSDVDAEYAADEIWTFLQDREALPNEALLALLDLPSDARTGYLLDKTMKVLQRRGAEVAGLLLAAMLPEAGSAHRAENAAAVVDRMDERELIAGFVDVLAGPAGDELKNATVGALIALGEPAVRALERALADPVASPWARDALDELRGVRTPAGLAQIEALEAAFTAAAYEPARPARDAGDECMEDDGDADR